MLLHYPLQVAGLLRPLEEDNLLHLQFQQSHLHRVVVYQQLLLWQYLIHRVAGLLRPQVEGLQLHQVEGYLLLQVVGLLRPLAEGHHRHLEEESQPPQVEVPQHPQDVAHQRLQAVDLRHPQVVAPLLPMHEVHLPLEVEVHQVVGLLDGVLQLEVAEAQQLHLK